MARRAIGSVSILSRNLPPSNADAGFPDERSITEHLRRIAVIPPSSQVVVGIGDDCAVYRPEGSVEDLLFTTDLFIEGVHFLPETHSAADIARKALARGLSDIAAMGGVARFCLVSLCVPKWSDDEWLRMFFAELVSNASHAGAVLAGGDLSHADTLACDIVVCGGVQQGRSFLRSGARPGDEIWVSGTLGGSALGLETGQGTAWLRHTNPCPRLQLANHLQTGLVRPTAAIDISDGLSLDLQRLCIASGVAAEITNPPQFPGTTLAQALHGGEEYELLFTIPPGHNLPFQFEGLPLTPIGIIKEGQPGRIHHNGLLLEPLGYDHFRN